MECGSQDVVCQVTTWVSENELAASWLVELAGRFGANTSGFIGALSQFLKDYGQSIIGLVGVSFGFWRWWRYREHILHKRLAEYLRESDARLADGTAQLIDAIRRPGPGQNFNDPLFVDHDLRTVLRERNWDNAIFALSVETSADWQLGKAIDAIERRLNSAHDMIASFRHQLCSAHSLRAAVAAAQADRTRNSEHHARALTLFRSALSVPGRDRDILLRELEAHQQRKLRLPTAKQAYENLAVLARELEDPRERDLISARAKRYIAEITFSNAPMVAFLMLTAPEAGGQHSPGALSLTVKHEPLSAWERLELGDSHYFAALCANTLGFNVAAPSQLGDAEAAYRRILIELGDRRFVWRKRYRRLRGLAREGIKRVEAARKGNYDANWLPS